MPCERAPAFNLYGVDFGQSPAEIVSAIPLKPAPRVGPVYPAFLLPYGERLAALDAEIVERGVRNVAYLCVGEPTAGKFIRTVVTIFSFENAHFEHLSGREVRCEVFGKILADGCFQLIAVSRLHSVVYFNRAVIRDKGRALQNSFPHAFEEFQKVFAEDAFDRLFVVAA